MMPKFSCLLSFVLLTLSLKASDAFVETTNDAALLIIDVQNCFCPNGTLPVPHGEEVVPIINTIRSKFKFNTVVRTQDWHPKNHVSFALNHPGTKIGDSVKLEYDANGDLCLDDVKQPPYAVNCSLDGRGGIKYTINQTMWPAHGVQNTKDAEFYPGQHTESSDLIVQKGVMQQLVSPASFNILTVCY